MEKSKTSNRYSPEMRARAVRMVLEHQGSYETQSAAVAAIARRCCTILIVGDSQCESMRLKQFAFDLNRGGFP